MIDSTMHEKGDCEQGLATARALGGLPMTPEIYGRSGPAAGARWLDTVALVAICDAGRHPLAFALFEQRQSSTDNFTGGAVPARCDPLLDKLAKLGWQRDVERDAYRRACLPAG